MVTTGPSGVVIASSVGQEPYHVDGLRHLSNRGSFGVPTCFVAVIIPFHTEMRLETDKIPYDIWATLLWGAQLSSIK